MSGVPALKSDGSAAVTPRRASVRRRAAPKAGSCRFLILGRIGNFELLRRHLGRSRAELLADDLVRIVRRVLPGAEVRVAASSLIEISVEGRSPDALNGITSAIEALFARPVRIDDDAYDVDMLLGAAVAAAQAADEVRLIEQAELALRQTGADRRLVVRDANAGEDQVDRIALARDLVRAVEAGELFLQYQPKMHVRHQRITSVEALVRWRHPERGLVLPGDFIPLAEETRAILPVTLWTIRQAIADQAVLANRGHDMRVFVNIAGVLLNDVRFVEEACALVAGKADKIGFEITETSVIRDPESAIANLSTFAGVGVHIAIDDYGAGLSSLGYLKRLPARELKIDKLFVTQLTTSNRDPLIVRSTIDLAHALEMEVVAEGVETQAALALLAVMGCDMIQGFLISRPAALEDLIAFLNDDRHAAAVQDSRATFGRLAATWKRG